MNNKGFTLIELLATIILLSIIISITAASVVGLINNSKKSSYEILVKNIKIGAQAYFEECENDNILDTIIECDLDNDSDNDSFENEMTFSLKDLLTYGFLKSSATDSSGNKIVENPMNNKDIGNCEIKITKTIDATSLTVNYSIVSISGNISGNTICPKTKDF